MKKIIITGATSGIGKATAQLAVKKGHKVLLTGRREDRLKIVCGELGEQASYKVLDVCDKKSITEFFISLDADFKDFDVIVNNAGLALGIEKVPDAKLEDWETMIQTNVTGLVQFTHEALKTLSPIGKGHIVNVGSVSGHIPYPGANVYGATKAFVKQFSLNLRTDLFGTDIRVSNIEPGMVETEFSEVRFAGDIKKAEKAYENYRPLKPEDVAESILWIIEQPARVNIDNIELMPTDQTYAGAKTTASLT